MKINMIEYLLPTDEKKIVKALKNCGWSSMKDFVKDTKINLFECSFGWVGGDKVINSYNLKPIGKREIGALVHNRIYTENITVFVNDLDNNLYVKMDDFFELL